jgi:hypothetical protein
LKTCPGQLGQNKANGDRALNGAFRAFRLSDKQVYAGPFTPPRQFRKTEDTLRAGAITA